MDLLKALRSKIDTLMEGDYTSGLRAVLLHIETAFGHLSRGQEQEDETAFTDAVYRTNQAFEGGIKEAYRVLAEKDPAKKNLFDIEKYLGQGNIFRQRVLAQFTNYRTVWRNPSTHDYKLDFDESEAFLAIVSVSAFACLLLDQIAEKLAYAKAKAEAEARIAIIESRLSSHEGSLLARTAETLREFSHQQRHDIDVAAIRQSEIQLIGAIAGFFASAAPDLKLTPEEKLGPNYAERIDLVVSDGSERILIEIKSAKNRMEAAHRGLAQLEHYLRLSGERGGILFLYSHGVAGFEVVEHSARGSKDQILIVRPKNAA